MNKNNIFKHVPIANVKRNLFDLSHEVKMSCKFGTLYPVLLMDTLPGDTIRNQMTALVRMAPMLAPVMHRIDVTTHFFFVPWRLLTDYWEDFITGGQDGLAVVDLPYVTPAGILAAPGSGFDMMKAGSLWDYFGLPLFPNSPPAVASTHRISAGPFRAYLKIWNDYYRDPNLDQEVDLHTELQGDVSSTIVGTSAIGLKQRGWEKDYFTSALPWAQRGAEVLMPLGGVATVDYSYPAQFIDASGNPIGNNGASLSISNDGLKAPSAAALNLGIKNIDSVTFQNSTISINDFRRSLAIQRWLENNARGGGRYIEQIQSHFNMRVPDYRLQRAEYLGGGKQPVTISEVVQTAVTTDGIDNFPLGELGGHGISVGKSNRFTYRCQEHGFIIGIMSIIPKSAYSQGLERLWFRQSKYDYAWPELANLGEQGILNKEIFMSFDNADLNINNATFGYIPRYAEYKFKNDRVAGDFRNTLGFWHLQRFFTQRPGLNSAFLMMNDEPDGEESYRRIFAVQDGTDYLWCQLFHRLTAKRPLPYFGIPSGLV